MPCPDVALLHALLDGALAPEAARACERHIADCAACRATRDEVSALRDAATALLARSAVRPRHAPSFATLSARAVSRKAEVTSREVTLGVVQPTLPAAHQRPRPPRTALLQAAGVAAIASAAWLAQQGSRASQPLPSTQSVASAEPAAAPPASANGTEPYSAGVVQSASAPVVPRRQPRTEQPTGVAAELPLELTTPVALPTTLRLAAPDLYVAVAASPAAPPAPAVRIQPLAPGSTEATVRSDDTFRLAAQSDEDEFVFVPERYVWPASGAQAARKKSESTQSSSDSTARLALKRPIP